MPAFRWPFSSAPRSTRRRAVARQRRVFFEPLEDRRLLALTDLASPVAPLSPPSSTSGDGASLQFGNYAARQHTQSADGRYVVFVSSSPNLVTGVTLPPNVQQVYRYDRDTQEVALVSVDPSGTAAGNQGSTNPTLSADGSRVAFQSSASNLDPLDPDGIFDIYVRELSATPTTFLASVNAAGTVKGNSSSYFPTLSADGSRVAFQSYASNLDPLDPDGYSDIYVRELSATPTTFLASVNAAGTVKGDFESYSPTLSADGSRVAFESYASNLDPLDTDSFQDIYVRELSATPTTFLASVNATGTVKGNNQSSSPTLSADGTRVAFVSNADNLDPLDLDTTGDIYVRELSATPTTFLASVDATGTVKGNNQSSSPTLSADGTRVAFGSYASNLDPLDPDSSQDIYVRELSATPTTFLASVNAAGTVKGDNESRNPTLSADGSRVAFESRASNLDPLDPDSNQDIYVRELSATPTTFLASVNAAGTVKGDFESYNPTLSADGSRVAFISNASNLVGSDLNAKPDVLLRSLDAATTDLASPVAPLSPLAAPQEVGRVSNSETTLPGNIRKAPMAATWCS